MFKKMLPQPSPPGSVVLRRRNVALAGAIASSLFASWTLLAYSDALKPVSSETGGSASAFSVRTFNGKSPAREYLDTGGRLIAAALQSTGTKAQFDFDGDLKTNIAVFRPSTGTWFMLKPNGDQRIEGWGISGDKLVPADYDGDGICDVAVFRPSSGTWWVKKSWDGGTIIQQFAAAGDIPVPGDYDGDGKANIAVFRPSTGTWFILKADGTQRIEGWGIAEDKLVPADYDGDGKCDIAVFRPSNGTWWVKKSSDSSTITQQFAAAGDIPVPGDYDGDGKANIAVFRPSTGTWFILKPNGDQRIEGWGINGDKLVPADYDGDGVCDVAVFRPSNGTWWVKKSFDGGTITQQFAVSGDIPVPSVYIDQAVSTAPPDSFSAACVDPTNRTGAPGEDLFSGNYNWSLPMLGLAGRAGLDLGLSLTYNSLVWTKSGSSIGFDIDKGFPAPGFRLGFPTIQQQTFASQSGAVAFLMIGPSGSRVELRQVTANLYESPDSSWLQLDTSASPFVLRTADGSQLSFQLLNGEYRCTKVKDRNGNYITINYDASGRITTIIDTLARTTTFVYSGNNLQKITQLWNNAEHIWAQFEYTALTIQTSFSGLSVVGPQNGTSINVLSKVTLDDLSSFDFEYSSYGQVKKVNRRATDNHLLGYTAYDMSTSAGQTDCPRFTKRTDFAEQWMTVETNFSFDLGAGFGQVTAPDGTLMKEYHGGSGFAKGLTTRTETFSSDDLSTPKKTTIATWTQDNEALAYTLNPRVIETNITDDAPNTRRVTIGFSSLTLPSGSVCKLPADVREYAANGTTVLRKTHTDYLAATSYLNQHIIGLRSASYLYDSDAPAAAPVSKVTYGYDDGASLSGQGATVQHDDSSYGTSFLTRGNLTSVTRWDVNTLGDASPQSVTSTMSYNTTGNLISSRDALGHQVVIGYADSFAATGTPHSGSTLAYPTNVTDPDGYTSTSQYDYDLGVPKITSDPKGATLTRTFDPAGRVSRIDSNSGGYTRFVFAPSMTEVDSYVLQTASPLVEIFSARFMDGAGRVIRTLGTLPGSAGGYTGQKFVYDLMGRLIQQSNPTEINSAWTPSGDDETTGWLYSYQSYDWKGRARTSTNTDNTTRELTYGGCGCAGGEVVTLRDEMNRRQRISYDVLGRAVKTESLNFDQSVYATRTDTYNARDQVTLMRQYQGTSSSSTFQDTVMTYDGHGRLVTQKAPIEASPSIYAYYADDTLKSRTDPRSARANFAYNGRHLATGISYCKPLECDGGQDDGSGEISPSASVAFGYDSAGNRLSMTDGLGNVLYQYDTWSRLKSEARHLSDLNQTKTISYDYNLANELTSLTDPFSSVTTYAYNQAGQLSSVSGSGPGSVPAYISQIQYRAWGAPKQITCGNGVNMTTGYNTRLQAKSFSSAGLMGATLSYYSDGRIHTEQSTVDRKFDRAYTYDHEGRLTDALSGSEAGLGSTLGGPYHQTFGYDVFGNMKDRSGQLWSAPGDAYSTGYVNDRNSAWSYDGAGNPTTQETLTAKYNSAGQRSSTTAPARHIGAQIVNLKLFEGYDGDGQQVAETRETTVGSTTTQITTYKIRSSLLGGQIVAELTNTGARQTGYVYANGQLIARQQFGSVTWVHFSPTNLSERWTNTSGQFAGASEYDPAHSAVGLDDPGPGPDGTSADLLYPRNGDPTDLSGGCTIDGMVAPCSVAMSVVNVGAGIATDPYETPSTRWNQTLNGGHGGYEVFHAFADGSGYGDISRYAGHGRFRTAPVLQRRSRASGRINPNDVSGGAAWRNNPSWVFLGTRSRDCLSALREAYGSDEATVNRAAQGYPYVLAAAEANGISAALLTAIGVRETHFRNVQETAVGHGQGIFQIDDRYHGTARSIGYDPPAAADYAARLLGGRFAHYTAQGYSKEIATAAAVHDYNSSSVHTAGALARGAGNLQRTIGALNGTTTGHNYVSNVLNLAANCFGNAMYFSDVPSLDSPVGED